MQTILIIALLVMIAAGLYYFVMYEKQKERNLELQRRLIEKQKERVQLMKIKDIAKEYMEDGTHKNACTSMAKISNIFLSNREDRGKIIELVTSTPIENKF